MRTDVIGTRRTVLHAPTSTAPVRVHCGASARTDVTGACLSVETTLGYGYGYGYVTGACLSVETTLGGERTDASCEGIVASSLADAYVVKCE